MTELYNLVLPVLGNLDPRLLFVYSVIFFTPGALMALDYLRKNRNRRVNLLEQDMRSTETFLPLGLHVAIAKIRLEEKAKKVRRLGESVPHAQNLQPIL